MSVETHEHHLNPHLIEWAFAEEGLHAQLRISHPSMEELPTAARDNLAFALGRFLLLCEFLVEDEDALSANDFPVEKSTKFLADYMLYLYRFYKSCATYPENK